MQKEGVHAITKGKRISAADSMPEGVERGPLTMDEFTAAMRQMMVRKPDTKSENRTPAKA